MLNLRLLIVCFLMWAYTSVSLAFTGFAGKVSDICTEKPIVNARVSLYGSAEFVVSNNEGNYQLAVFQEGIYEVQAQVSGYAGMSFGGQTVQAGIATVVNFSMLPLNPTPEQERIIESKLNVRRGSGITLLPEISLALSYEGVYLPEKIRILVITEFGKSVVEKGFEEYLRGVVPVEMPLGKEWQNLEALKAQAIVARTYALHHLGKHTKDGADVCSTTHCQIWSEWHDPRSDKAVEETKGMVMTYRGRVIDALYFAHCEGKTLNSEAVFPDRLSYCRSTDCLCGAELFLPLVLQGALDNAQGKVPPAEVTSAFQNQYGALGNLIVSSVEEKNAEGRGISWWIDEVDYLLRRFHIKFEDEQLKVYRLYGHQVGMCQDGAAAFAAKGYNFRYILKHYYKDIDIVEVKPNVYAAEPKTPVFVQTTSSVKVRKAPKIDPQNFIDTITSNRIGQIIADPLNHCLTDNHYWWRVKFSDIEGWCAEDYLRVFWDSRLLNIDNVVMFDNREETMEVPKNEEGKYMVDNNNNFFYLKTVRIQELSSPFLQTRQIICHLQNKQPTCITVFERYNKLFVSANTAEPKTSFFYTAASPFIFRDNANNLFVQIVKQERKISAQVLPLQFLKVNIIPAGNWCFTPPYLPLSSWGRVDIELSFFSPDTEGWNVMYVISFGDNPITATPIQSTK